MTIAYMTDGDSSGKVYVIDTNNSQILQPTSGITVGNNPIGVAFSPDGSVAVVTNNHQNDYGTAGTISFINTVTGAVVATVSPGGLPNGVAIAQYGSNIYAYVALQDSYSPSGTDGIAIYNMAGSHIATRTIGAGAMPHGVAATPDNNYIYVADSYGNTSGPGAVTIVATATNTIVTTFAIAATDYTSYGIAITPIGSPPRCFVTLRHGVSGAGTVAYFDADGSSQSTIGYVNVGGRPSGIVTDGSMVYVATSSDNRLYYFSATSPPSTASYISTGGSTVPLGVALTPDGSKLYVGASGPDSTLVYTPSASPDSAPTLDTTINSSGGGSVGMFILQNETANIPFAGGASFDWFGL